MALVDTTYMHADHGVMDEPHGEPYAGSQVGEGEK